VNCRPTSSGTTGQTNSILGNLGSGGVFIRYLLVAGCLLLTMTHLVEGYVATACGVIAVVELVTALLRYSPLYDLYYNLRPDKTKPRNS